MLWVRLPSQLEGKAPVGRSRDASRVVASLARWGIFQHAVKL